MNFRMALEFMGWGWLGGNMLAGDLSGEAQGEPLGCGVPGFHQLRECGPVADAVTRLKSRDARGAIPKGAGVVYGGHCIAAQPGDELQAARGFSALGCGLLGGIQLGELFL